VGRRPAELIEADGTHVLADPLILEEALELTGGNGRGPREPAER
jgi:hypothetical protein